MSMRVRYGSDKRWLLPLFLVIAACGGTTVQPADGGARDSAMDAVDAIDAGDTDGGAAEDSGTLPMPCVQAGRCLDGLYCAILISSDGGSTGTCLSLPSNCPPVATCACLPPQMNCAECSDDGHGHIRSTCTSG